MPYVDGQFVPSKWIPLTRPLFDVIAPDDRQGGCAAREADWEWYRGLRQATAEVLLYILGNVAHNYDRYRGVAFTPRQVAPMMRCCARIARDYLSDDDSGEVTGGYVNRQINLMAKTFGLVVHSTEPGRRHNWPMLGQDVTLDLDDALEYVEAALRGRYDRMSLVRQLNED